MLSAILSIVMSITAMPDKDSCWVESGNTVHSKPGFLNMFPYCWVGQTQKKNGASLKKNSLHDILQITWKPCDFHHNGFRTEITEPYDAKFHNTTRKFYWGPKGQLFSRAVYNWSFSFNDQHSLLSNWANGAFIAQLHSYSHPLDKSVKGGSPVIGLYLTKEKNSETSYRLILTTKVFRSTGYCHKDETPRNKGYCIKNLVAYSVEQGVEYSLTLDITDDINFNTPGLLKFNIEGLEPEIIRPHHLTQNQYFQLPNRQNSQANYFKMGWYVNASKKKKQFKQQNKQLFCNAEGSLIMNMHSFSFIRYK